MSASDEHGEVESNEAKKRYERALASFDYFEKHHSSLVNQEKGLYENLDKWLMALSVAIVGAVFLKSDTVASDSTLLVRVLVTVTLICAAISMLACIAVKSVAIGFVAKTIRDEGKLYYRDPENYLDELRKRADGAPLAYPALQKRLNSIAIIAFFIAIAALGLASTVKLYTPSDSFCNPTVQEKQGEPSQDE